MGPIGKVATGAAAQVTPYRREFVSLQAEAELVTAKSWVK